MMTKEERHSYVIGQLEGVSRALRHQADRVDRQIERAKISDANSVGLPLADLVEQAVHDVLWAIPNLQLERILYRAMEPTDD
jgi:hypothetical protein